MWTLIGAGAKKFQQCHKPTSQVLTDATWIKDSVADFSPDSCAIVLKSGKQLQYDALIIGIGLQLRYDMIKGLPEAFSTPGIGSNYHPEYVHKTYESIKNFREGNAVFTYPQTTIKCPGAPQKIMYLTDHYLRKNGRRDKANLLFCTAASFMFGVKAYNGPLEKICDDKGVIRNYLHTLTEVKPNSREAIFDIKNPDGKVLEQKAIKYEMLHVAPPCSAPEILRKQTKLVDQTGFLNLNKDTLQHVAFPNIFGLGDCTNLPTSKTAAAAGVESGVLQKNVVAFLNNRPLTSKYTGYASCPLVTSYNTGIMPEFDYSLTPLETLPIDQSKERHIFYYMKADLMPFLYWNGLVKGYWKGPQSIRKMCSNRKQRHVDSIFHREKRQSRYGSRRILSGSLQQEVLRYRSCIAQCSDGPGNAEKRRRPRRGSGGGGRSGHRSGEYNQRMSNSDHRPNIFARCLRDNRCYTDEKSKGRGECHSNGMERSEPERKTMCSCLQNVYGPDAVSCDDSQQSFGGGGRNTGGGGSNGGGGEWNGNRGGGTGNGIDNGISIGSGNGGVPTRPPDYDII
uniref:Sulfide:quinone oxidoreductase, mitochondrial n=1 Tax=Romanomermis culicivorax TaxID=13658 RepID=A0A915K9S0_ROMCU